MEKISKNCYKGEVITNPFDIINLSIQRRSIYYINWGIKPASVFLSMQFKLIIKLIENRQLYTVININNQNKQLCQSKTDN